ncbi:MAG: putative hydro-lyase [SAR324 cluster bacterium]|nr:putative hydro-lyase [SAR324 cluster bacterium]
MSTKHNAPTSTFVSAEQVRTQIRSRDWTTLTSGVAKGFVQGNLVMLPKSHAFEFLLFCTRNPKPCPILDVLEPGVFEPTITPGADLRSDLPRYRIYKNGVLAEEVEDVTAYCSEEMVSFLLGCSYSFERALLEAGLPIRNMEEGKNVSMYITNRECAPAGPFHTPMVVSMRPMTSEQAVRAAQITTRFERTHGAPIHWGDPETLGIRNLDEPDFGEAVTIRDNEVPVFWACGVTSALAAASATLPLVITHAPGHMFISDLRDEELTIF